MRLGWPKSSHFPSQFTARVAELSASDSHRHRLWLDRLKRAGDGMAAEPGRHPHAVVEAQRTRAEAGSGGLGGSR